MKPMQRREFMKSMAAFGAMCGLTPPQTEGPFYPGEELFKPDNDLTLIPGKPRAKGQVIYVRGQVLNEACRPVVNANVEIWQACASGKYNNRKDPNPALIDPNFKYWGEAFTNQNGEYMFKTIVPGAYPADENWIRPPHIHFKVSALGYQELVTQMYFKGDPRNTKDLILDRVPISQRESVIVDFKPAPPEAMRGSFIGNFNITLQSVRSLRRIRI